MSTVVSVYKAWILQYELNVLVMKKITLLGLLIGLISTSSIAQNTVWYFGAANSLATSYGLDFSAGGAPVQRNYEGVLDYYESVSVVSNNDGDVLYYTDGIELYDASNTQMMGSPAPDGKLKGTQDGTSGSSVQGAYSLLKPGSTSEYFLFTSQAIDGAANGLRVNRIDMNRPGNGTPAAPLGELVTADSLLRPTGTEMMTAYGNCGSDSVWVITHAPSSWDFVRILVTRDGIQSVATQTLPTPTAGGGGFISALGRGSMDINAAGTKLMFTGEAPIGTHILDFDKHTGLVSNHKEIQIPSQIWPGSGFKDTYFGYGSEFSPDGSKAYFCSIKTAFGFKGVWQYDLATETCEEVAGSSGSDYGEIITGIDDKLYFGKVSQEMKLTVGVMDLPNNDYSSTSFDPDAIAFPGTPGGAVSYAMPQGFYCPLSVECEIDAVAPTCDSTSAFALTATPTGGTWGGGAYITAGGTFDPVAAGPGDHWVTYDAGCGVPDSLQISVITCCGDIDPDLGSNTTICGNLTQTLDAGSGYDTYRWYENGTLIVAATGSTTVADSGTYVVQVTDADGCPGADTIEIGNYAVPQPNLGPDVAYCATQDVTVDAGPGYVSYAWSPSGGSSRTATFSAVNTYTVTVTDANGCEGTDDISISENALPTPSITGPSAVCEDADISLTGVAGSGGTLNWTGMGATNPITVTAAGTYTLVETDGNGCIDSVSQVVTLESAPSFDLGGPFDICRTQETELLDATTAGATYVWQDGSTDPTFDATDAGLFWVEVTGSNGCVLRDSAVVDTFSLPTVNLGADDSYCEGLSLTLDAGLFDAYSWSTGGSSQTEVISSAATVSVVVTDANGCTATDEIVISEDALPDPSINGPTAVCDNGDITLTGFAGSGGSLTWTGIGVTNPIIVTEPGSYTLVETDANGCIDSVTRVITEELAPDIELGGPFDICRTQETQLLDATTAGATYEWSDGSTDPTLDATDAGEYWVEVTASNGCVVRDTAVIDTFSLPTVSLGGDTYFCTGGTVTLDAGLGFADYSWSTGGSSSTEIISGVAEISVVVTDGNGCTATDTSDVTENELPTVDLGGDLGVCGGDSVIIDATHPDAASYLWTPDGETSSSIKVSSDDATYGVTIVDVDGCEFTTSKTIISDTPPTVDIGDLYTVCFGQEEQTLDATTGLVGETYLWSTGETSASIDFGDSSMVWVRVSTADGCSAYDTAYVDTFSVPTVNLGDDAFFCSGTSITLDAGLGFADYSWSTGGTSSTEVVSAAAEVSVIVTDGNGCTATDTTNITENELPIVDLGSAISVCDADSITLRATHPDAASYAWLPGGETVDTLRVGSETATYTVTITDVDGCEYTTSREISEEDPPTVSLGGDDIICDNVTKTLDAGFEVGATYEWYLDGSLLIDETEQTLDADSGIYVVTVRNALGCEISDTAYIDNHQLPEVTLADSYAFCEGDSVELDAGPFGVSYSWESGATGRTTWVSEAGTITVTITDVNSCENSGSVDVGENPLPEIDLGGNDSACVGLEIVVDAELTDGVSYVWSDGFVGSSYTLSGPDTISVTVTDVNGCVDSATKEVKALDPLDLTYLDDENQVCEGFEDLNPLDAGDFEGAEYIWTLPDGSTEEGQVITPYLDGVYTIDVTDRFNCVGAFSITNNLVVIPSIDLGPDTSFCSLGKDQYDVLMTFSDATVSGTISWSQPNMNDNDSIFTAFEAPITVIGTFTEEETNCPTSDTVKLSEYCEPIVPIFPNNWTPGSTTTYTPIAPEGTDINDLIDNILWSDFEIYNRWGLKVFQSSNVIPSWDGFFEGLEVPGGAYYYIYRFEDSSRKEYHLNGFFQILK